MASVLRTDSDNYFRLHKALNLVVRAALPCVDICLRNWHQHQKQITQLPTCTNNFQCPSKRKPKSPNSCASCVDWGTRVEAALSMGAKAAAVINWRNVSPPNLSISHIEVAKAFALSLPSNSRASTVSDFDAASLLMIMTRFMDFHQGDVATLDVIKRVTEMRNELSHISLGITHVEETQMEKYFTSLKLLVNCLATLYPSQFTVGPEIEAQLHKIRFEPTEQNRYTESYIQTLVQALRAEIAGEVTAALTGDDEFQTGATNRIERSTLNIGDIIGEGGESTVHKGTWLKPGSVDPIPVAIKKVLKSVDCRELQALAGLCHPNIIEVFGFSESRTDLWIVMELCTIGSLKNYLETHKDKPMPLQTLLDWCLQAALPIQYLQLHGISHKDIKTDNYIITIGATGSKILKLIDFGIAKRLDTTTTASGTGTWRWMAPELHDDCQQSPLSDIYALALILWSLVTREVPYHEHKTQFSQAKAICSGCRPVIPAYCPDELAHLIMTCWEHDRRRRPPIDELVLAMRAMIAMIKNEEHASFNKYNAEAMQVKHESVSELDDLMPDPLPINQPTYLPYNPHKHIEKPDEPEDNNTYDAYVICMDDNDGSVSSWVADYLIPNIEESQHSRSGRLCYPTRDFSPGHPIFENMHGSLNESRNVVVVLSSKSNKNGIQDHALQLTQLQMIERPGGCVTVVFLDEIRDVKTQVSFILSFLLSSKPPLIWSEDEAEQRLFWRRLRNELL